LLALVATTASAAPPLYTLVSDALDADAPAATLPAGPVELALADLAREQPKAKLLEPLRRGERNGQRYALAAWQGVAGAKDWDAILVVATAGGARTLEISSSHKDRAAALEALIAYGTTGTAPAAVPPPAAAIVAPLPLPTAWDPRFVVFYAPNPAYRPGEAAAESALTDAHIQYTLRLQAEGKAQAAGPFSSGGVSGGAGPAAPIGMTLLRVRDLAAATSIAQADPAVVAGRLLVTVREWNVPAGRLQ
jgi:uncharacterized protein YciI